MEVEYGEIVTLKPVQRFLLKFYLLDTPIQSLILISPYVGTLEGTRVTLDAVCRKAVEKGIPTYVITRSLL